MMIHCDGARLVASEQTYQVRNNLLDARGRGVEGFLTGLLGLLGNFKKDRKEKRKISPSWVFRNTCYTCYTCYEPTIYAVLVSRFSRLYLLDLLGSHYLVGLDHG